MNKTHERIREVIKYMAPEIRMPLIRADENMISKIEEIRLGAGAPAAVSADGRIYFLNVDGTFSETSEKAVSVNTLTLQKTLDKMCAGSVYSRQNELKYGFLTLDGGHRVGVCGKTVLEGGEVSKITDISSMNIRIAREIIGAADKIMPYIVGNKPENVLIISPPACGKTTLLRDIARRLGSEEMGYRVGIADERGEIAAMHMGEAQNDVGILTDVYDSCPKAEGMLMLLRTMSPDVIITDEIGTPDDEVAIKRIINAGVRVICSVHGYDKSDVLRREGIGTLVRDGVFEKIIVLSRRDGAGTLERVY